MATNTTNDGILGWVQEPDGRGTFGILKSCVITLVLCVYAALHLNIPPANSSQRFLFWRKTKWILVSIFAPEIVVYVAWAQRQRVAMLSNQLAEIFSEEAEKDPTLRRKHDWTTTHSWYAYMGGFAIDTQQGQEDLPGEYIPGSPRLALNRKAVRILARSGMLPDISRESINDKSKADALAKFLAITQASWLILQCVMRFSYRLPVTALELNTLAHAVCALLVYALWWEKPLDIAEPTMLTEEWAPGLAASLWVCSGDTAVFHNAVEGVYWIDQAFADCLQSSCTTRGSVDRSASTSAEDLEAAYSMTVIDTYARRKTTHDLTVQGSSHPITFTLRNGERDKIVVAKFPGANLLWTPTPDRLHVRRTAGGYPATFNIERSHLIRWQLLQRFVYDYPKPAALIFGRGTRLTVHPVPNPIFWTEDAALCQPKEIERLIGRTQGFYTRHLRPQYHNGIRMATAAIPNSPDPQSSDTIGTQLRAKSLVVFGVAALIYGAIHAAGWNDYFATPTEALLWKISCIYVAGCGCLAMFIMAMWYIPDQNQVLADHYYYNRLQTSWKKIVKRLKLARKSFWGSLPATLRYFVLSISLRFIIEVPTLFYLFCRAFLVIEGFIGLRSLPAKAFHTPEWTQYLAHL
ncbi:hypothetical protein B0T18DRAFT_185082 [Schizothecium vesticola]|uniref:Uncharacterized protein n=1 Tax=Schizothecium vesticola TaxID=314040 RepID=A0AA40EQ53_9PEZI|nr:hypothetical protein B0T18DRAFT_185082 [Schizothecium vesticola]